MSPELSALVELARVSAYSDDQGPILAELAAAIAVANPSDQGSLLLAQAIARQGHEDPAVPASDAIASLDLLRDSERPGEAAWAAAVAAAMSHRAGRVQASIEYAVEAMVLSETNHDAAGTSRALNSLAVMFLQFGAYELAADLSARALSLDGETPLEAHPAIAFTAGLIVVDGLRRGCDLDRASLDRAIEILADGAITNDIARHHLAPGLAAERALLDDDLDELRRLDLLSMSAEGIASRLAAWFRLVQAGCAHVLGDSPTAIDIVNEIMPVVYSLGDHDQITRALTVRRDARRVLGEHALALDDAIELVDHVSSHVRDHVSGLSSQISERAKVEVARFALSLRAHRLAEEVSTDALTGVRTRRWLDIALEELGPTGGYATVVMIDLDHFKLVNDRFGHQVGDEVLRRVGRILRENFRTDDLVARFGGEEFVAVLPRTSRSAGRAFVNRVRDALAAEPWHEIVAGLRVRASAGIASGALNEIESVLGQADDALYRAKRAGRDRVVAA